MLSYYVLPLLLRSALVLCEVIHAHRLRICVVFAAHFLFLMMQELKLLPRAHS